MNSKKEVKKIKVNSGVELVSQAREYKNSGGEWKLRERYMEMRTGSMKKCPKWGIIISNGKQKIDICSTNNVFVESGIRDEVKVRDELEKLFPKYGEALFAGSDKEHDRYGGRPHQSKLDFNTYKRVKDTDGECDLVRYLVAESSWDLKKILHEYIQENETKIYQSANPHFSGWVEIVDGQDGNIYLYVGEKNEGGGREIKVGVKKEAFYKTEHNFYAKSGGGYYSAEEMLELAWNLFTITRPRTSAETHEYYSKNGGLEQEWQRNWPHRQGLCRKYLEELRERMNQKFNYLQDKAKQKNYQDNEVNEQIILAKFHAEEINYHLTDMKKNRPDYYAACDKDCSICGVKLCCHFEGRPCEKNKNNLSSLSSEFHTGEILPPPTLPSNPLTAAERELIKKLFLKSGTELIKLENDKLIGYRQGKWSELEINDNSELQLFKRAISQNSSQSLSFADFSSTGSNSSSSHQKLYLGLGLGAGGVLLAGAVVYFWKQKRNRS